ncbi:MAG: hypothetical protein PHH30_05765 [Bacteroidales bacterium]|nr:hypothetical protein [Bacteroidales bacterium]MDD3858728.1 hypothetical protein [Bacteroidales bacterium]
MKKIFLLFAFAIIATGVYSQRVEVKENTGQFRSGNKNSFVTTVYHSDIKTVTKEFTSLLKGYKGKVSSKKGEIFGDNLMITSISNNTIDVYAIIKETKDGDVEVTAAFDLGGACISSSTNSEQFGRASDIMREFALELTEKGYANFLKSEEKVLKESQKEYEKMVDLKKDLTKDNEDYKKKIEQNEKEIDKLTKDIEDKGKEVKEKEESYNNLKKGSSKIK